MPVGEGEAPAAVADLLRRCTFPPRSTRLTCAVSGGADSLALLVLAVAAGCEVTAVHVDHALRAGSAQEAQVVAAAAERFGARFETRRVSVAPGPNLEARARAARIAVLPPGSATGHTMDDQAETVLLNLLRGSGPDGTAGMEPGVRHPMLGLRRRETHALCAGLGLTPVCDASNVDPAFTRNRVRHELLPLSAAVAGRDPVPLLARHAALVRDEAALVEVLARRELPDPADARALAAASRPLARRAVRRLVREAGTGTGPGTEPGADDRPPSLAEVERVLGGGSRRRRRDGAVRRPAGAPPRRPAPGRNGRLR